jgi:ElaB/YqjD/DUF883 family membrane-anchored ribosome-binding protein
MTQQRAKYPLDYTKGPASTANASQATDDTIDRLKEVTAGAQEYAEQIGQQARECGEKAQDAVRRLKPFVERSLKEQPLRTMAGAMVIGFILGALWKK